MNNPFDDEDDKFHANNTCTPYIARILALLYFEHPQPLDIDIKSLAEDGQVSSRRSSSEMISQVVDMIFYLIMDFKFMTGNYMGDGVFTACQLTEYGLTILNFPAHRVDGSSIKTGEQMLSALEADNVQAAIDALAEALMFDGAVH